MGWRCSILYPDWGHRNQQRDRILYVNVYDSYKEQTSSFVVKIMSPNKAENWTYFKVKDAQWDALQVRLGVVQTQCLHERSHVSATIGKSLQRTFWAFDQV